MNTLETVKNPCVVICHFRNEETIIERTGGRVIMYQVSITCDEQQLSPKGDYIRFGDVTGDEMTGWQLCTNIVIDEVLFEYQKGEYFIKIPIEDEIGEPEGRFSHGTKEYDIPYIPNRIKVAA